MGDSGSGEKPSQYNPGVKDTAAIDVLLATLNAAEVGSLDAIVQKMKQVQDGLESLGEAELAGSARAATAALMRGEVAEFRRARAFLQSKIGHLR
jgi:hypothetical protein